jgi:putative endonuclease
MLFLFPELQKMPSSKKYYLYILECADKTFYTGITVDLLRRLWEHNNSKLGACYTKSRRPLRLVYSKKFPNRSSASQEEYRVKKLSKADKMKIIKSAAATAVDFMALI